MRKKFKKMKITPLRIIIFIFILVVGGRFLYNRYFMEFRGEVVKKELYVKPLEPDRKKVEDERIGKMEEDRKRAEEEEKNRKIREEMEMEKLKEKANLDIAVSGEIILCAKKNKRDVSFAQNILRQAKEAFGKGDYNLAVQLAKESRQEVEKSSRPVYVKKEVYTKYRGKKRKRRIHVVRRGDCLWFISRRYYGTGFLWPKIWQANRDQIEDPDVIEVGQRFWIPYR